MRQIHAFDAQAVTSGSPSIVAGDIDTGIDWQHPDLAASVDFSRSVSCIGGAPNTSPSAWFDGNGHGTVCSFMWAATHGINVTNNSYFADPWYFNCRNDPEQRAIWTAERRAIAYAQQQGVSLVAATGDFSDDLAHPTQDIISPDTARTRSTATAR